MMLGYTLQYLKTLQERDKLKITFVMLGLKDHSTGGYNFNHKMAEAMSDAGHQVDVVHYSTIPHNIRGSRVRGSFHVLKRVLKSKPDLLVLSKSYSFAAPLRFLLPILKCPVLYLVHHLEWHDRAGGVSTLRKRIVSWFLSCARKIWVNSQSTANDVISLGIKESRLCIIPPGFERFNLENSSSEENGEQSPVRILSVGTICSRKDQLTLVRACLLLGDLDFHLYLLGDEKTDTVYAASVRKEAEQLGSKVTFMGHLPASELYRMYNESHILANLSHWEGYGIAVAEAMWAALPVVAVDAGAVPELVTHGENGYLTEAGNAEMCAGFLEQLIKDRILRIKMSTSAREKAGSLFSWHDTGREFVNLAEKTAGCKVRRNKSRQRREQE